MQLEETLDLLAEPVDQADGRQHPELARQLRRFINALSIERRTCGSSARLE
jgi:hypothetical protein